MWAASALSVLADAPGTRSAQPTAAVPVAGGWTARFFVNPAAALPGMADEPIIRNDAAAGVNAQFSKRLWRGTRVTVDVLNVFDREPPVVTGLLPAPAEGRGFRLTLRKTF
jgi:outer membrane receptor protein involved in Fe transport